MTDGDNANGGKRGEAGSGAPPERPHEEAQRRWALWRLDDNGNRFVMETYDSRERAEAAARDYAARGHKQTYWVEPA